MLFPPEHCPEPLPRVVVTGAGIVTGLGVGWKANAEGFREGRVAIRPITLFDASRQRVKVAGEVTLPPAMSDTRFSARQVRRLDRAARLLLLAAAEAWRQSGWKPSPALPIVIGTTSGGMSLGQEYYRQAMSAPHSRRRQPTRVLHYQAQQQALNLADALGCRGPLTIIANACASGANALGHAWHLLRSGRAQRVLTGGYDALSQMVFAGFDSLQALSTTCCRPFDARRDGLAIGEGAAVLALETLEHAERRGSTVLAEIVGYGAATDAHHLTQPHPQGHAAVATMTEACRSAGITPGEIGYLNAHGTGTPLNDSAEAAAINRWAGEHASRIPVSSTKSSIGHLLGAAGAVEVIVCLMALREAWLPPTSTLESPDPVCAFPLVPKPTAAKVDYALSNSFGFGGATATIIVRRWELQHGTTPGTADLGRLSGRPGAFPGNK